MKLIAKEKAHDWFERMWIGASFMQILVEIILIYTFLAYNVKNVQHFAASMATENEHNVAIPNIPTTRQIIYKRAPLKSTFLHSTARQRRH